MPLLVKDIDWSQTEDIVQLNLPLKGASAKHVDIFVTNLYIKVNYPPYFYEVALNKEINDDTSKATISNGLISFLLQKKQPGLWNQLNSCQSDDKNFLRQLRLDVEKYKHEKEEEKAKWKAAEKDQRKKMAVREQMKLDEEERKDIAYQKKEEKKEACEEIEEWKEKSIANNNENNVSNKSSCNGNSDNIETNTHSSNTDVSLKHEVDHLLAKEKELPPPRQRGEIEIKFTPRQLATPARESKLPEEELWLEKVAQMNKMKQEKFADAADMEEMNPIWLKDKGNEFYKKENYVAAINAYTTALMLDSKIPMLYANRAACHLHLKQYQECIQDCTSALEFYDPPVPANALSRCRALTRRGTAYFKVGFYVDALKDYNAALKLDPQNEALKVDAYKIRTIIQGAESSD